MERSISMPSTSRAGRPTEAATQVREYLAFQVGKELYGVDILRVQEIRGFEMPTRIAGATEVVRGVLNLRGVIVPILDLRHSMGLPADIGVATVTIVMNLKQRTVGFVVDGVTDVVGLAPAQIQPAPELADGGRGTFIQGLGELSVEGRQQMLILLDADQLLGQLGDSEQALLAVPM